MTAFCTWPSAGLYAITLLMALCVLSQTLAVVLSFYRRRGVGVGPLAHNCLELAVLIQIIVCSLLHGQIIRSLDILLIAPAGYAGLRIITFIAVSVLAAIAAMSSRGTRPLFVIPAAMLTLPAFEHLPGGAFTTLFLAALIFWLIRSVCAGMNRYKDIATNISALSVKNAVDSLFTGLMYYEENGFILLSNTRMQSLMTAITGRVRRNGRLFYRMLSNEEIEPGCRIASFEGHRVCLLPGDSAWMFTESVLFIRKKRYTQLTATDISERWKLTEELQSQNEELKQRQRELDDTIANLHILSHEQETQKARMRAHDILGERLSLLLRTVRSEQALDFTLLLSLSQGLMDEIKAVESALSPEDAFDILKREFETIGVEIVLDGELPCDGEKSRLFVEIIRESVTNAVRHGLATQVTVRIGESPAGLRMEITDNGRLLSDTITEGGGIRGMKEKIKPFGGVLSITTQPGFKLKVDLPVEADG